jgi:hypothetical protein
MKVPPYEKQIGEKGMSLRVKYKWKYASSYREHHIHTNKGVVGLTSTAGHMSQVTQKMYLPG